MSQEPAKLLLEHFTSKFLQGLFARDEVVLGALSRAYNPAPDTSSPPKLTIRLDKLFEALCLSAQMHDVAVNFSDWGKTFKQFSRMLMHPWPVPAIASAGYSIKLAHRGNSHASLTITLLPNNSFKPTPQQIGLTQAVGGAQP